jgi:hypothetical protein
MRDDWLAELSGDSPDPERERRPGARGGCAARGRVGRGARHAARLQAADRIVERILSKVGEKLPVEKQDRREVTLRYDVERLAEIVSELNVLGVIDAEAPACD